MATEHPSKGQFSITNTEKLVNLSHDHDQSTTDSHLKLNGCLVNKDNPWVRAPCSSGDGSDSTTSHEGVCSKDRDWPTLQSALSQVSQCTTSTFDVCSKQKDKNKQKFTAVGSCQIDLGTKPLQIIKRRNGNKPLLSTFSRNLIALMDLSVIGQIRTGGTGQVNTIRKIIITGNQRLDLIVLSIRRA
ncbi:unnamed protein product [Schistosoma mattheei]|uniref:Uncharacterized protein n=1 Tax=Schistosoma mattheei TaxID=31246 RepID=A0AA85BGC6_9TREM|nr:unnamed protein product [Schistosoma mattheei]